MITPFLVNQEQNDITPANPGIITYYSKTTLLPQ